jgi:ribosomal protein S18 acetylase RimI-like enzyme
MIRRLAVDDAGQFRDLRLLGLERHPEAFATGADAWRTPDEAAVAASMGTPDAPFDRFVLGAFEDARLVGAFGFKREARESLRHKGTCWGLIVHPDVRRRGHGGALVGAMTAELRRAPDLAYARVVVTTSPGDAPRLFRAHGFVDYGTERDGLRVAGRAFDQAFLRFDFAGG